MAVQIALFFTLTIVCTNVNSASHIHYTVPEIAQKVASSIDTDGNGFVTGPEIKHDLDTRFDSNDNDCTDVNEFVHRWTHDYFEDKTTTTAVFHIFDKNDDGCINLVDIGLYLPFMDANKDNEVSDTEFINWMVQVYPHGNDGQGAFG